MFKCSKCELGALDSDGHHGPNLDLQQALQAFRKPETLAIHH